MARLEIGYQIGQKDLPEIVGFLSNKSKEISSFREESNYINEKHYIGELDDAWKQALENLKKGRSFDIKVDKESFTTLDFKKRAITVLSEESEEVERRYWTARVPGASDQVRVKIFGKSVDGFGDYPLVIQLDFDTYGYSDNLFLSRKGAFHHGPEGISVTRNEEVERRDYHAAMTESTCGSLHLWRDVFGDLDAITNGISAVGFFDSSEFHLILNPDTAIEVGDDRRGINEEILRGQALKIIRSGELI